MDVIQKNAGNVIKDNWNLINFMGPIGIMLSATIVKIIFYSILIIGIVNFVILGDIAIVAH